MQEFIRVPDILQAKIALFLKYFTKVEHPLREALQTLFLYSDYANRQIEILTVLLAEDDCSKPLFFGDYQALLSQLSTEPLNFARDLRRFRHRYFLRLMLREIAGLADIEETMLSWSDCADALILKALAYCGQEMSRRYGQPIDESGKVSELYVLAMGKLGGKELNYSSDIDLIFAFSAAGFTERSSPSSALRAHEEMLCEGEERITNQQYYSRLVQQFMQLMQNASVDGFVFRVDLRLRPNGDSGALVSSLAAMETYYQEQGRDWERYAMVKARLIGADPAKPSTWFQRLITPFVYRRYVDFSVIESLRSMKTLIEREVQLNPMLDDIKRGFGGIREIEFIIQSFQLIRGGRLPQLRQQSAMAALDALKQEGLLTRTAALKEIYLFLRKLENGLQGLNDQQTHSLPKDEQRQAQLLLLLGYESWEQLLKRLEQYQRIVSTIFRSVLRTVDAYEDENRLIANQLSGLWQGHVETTMAVNLLASLGFQQAEHCYQMLYAFRHAPRCRRLSQAARLRLDRFMPLLLSELTRVPQTDAVLLQVLHLLENIVGRSAYLALLTENPQVVKELLHWFEHSPFITSLVVNQPFLLETLLDQEQKGLLASHSQLEQQLQARLTHCPEYEMQEEALRQFKLTHWLIAARAELYGHYDALAIGRFLADVADVIVIEVLALACQQLSQRYPQMIKIKSSFAILAYGKLGSREMNFNSDLDLVFIHASMPEEESLVTRLSQKIMHMLTTRSQTGVLYAVDTRLRPSGSAGLLVSHIDAFIEYQRSHAWTWEHQALLRARVVSANKRVRHAFKQLKVDVLFLARDKKVLGEEVLAMRARINRYTDELQVKFAAGGLLDLEFLVQYLVLANPEQSLARYTNTLSLLQILYAKRVLSSGQFARLKQAYKLYHQLLHHNLLQPNGQCPAYELQLADVILLIKELYQ